MTAPWTQRGTGRRLLPLLFGAFALLSLYETAHALYAPRAVATDGDWEAAAAEVRAGFHDGDLIVFAPYWSDQVGRQHLGDLVTPAMAGRADADRYSRVWAVSLCQGGWSGCAHPPESEGAKLLSAKAVGRLQVALYEKSPAVAIAYDFTAHLDDARVIQLPKGQLPKGALGDQTPCLENSGGFQCSSTRIERRTLEIDYFPRRGVLAPVDGALITRLEFPKVPLGSEVVGYTGMHDYYSRKNSDGPVDFALFIDGQRVASIHHLNSDGWRRFTFDTTRYPGSHAVAFEISAPSPAWRTFGFHVEARK